LSDELEKLEEVLEKKIKEEPYGGILRIPKPSRLEVITEKITRFSRRISSFLTRSKNVPRIRGILLGFSVLLVVWVLQEDTRIGLSLLGFLLLMHILVYPKMVSLSTRFITYVLLDLVRKGSIASILTPREIEEKLVSVEYVLCASLPMLALIAFPANRIVVVCRIVFPAIAIVAAIAYYYLTMAMDCWKNPVREISERNILSINFLVLLVVFVACILEIYTIVPSGYGSIFCWIITLLSYAFISTILAVPSFQAALYVTTLWRGEDTRKMFEELQKKVKWWV